MTSPPIIALKKSHLLGVPDISFAINLIHLTRDKGGKLTQARKLNGIFL